MAQKRFKAQFLYKLKNMMDNGRKQALVTKVEKWLYEFVAENCHQRELESDKKFEERKQKVINTLLSEVDVLADKKLVNNRFNRINDIN